LALTASGDLLGGRRDEPAAHALPVPPLDDLTPPEGASPLLGPFMRLARAFAQAARGGAASGPTFADGLRVQEVLNGVQRASRDGQWVALGRAVRPASAPVSGPPEVGARRPGWRRAAPQGGRGRRQGRLRTMPVSSMSAARCRATRPAGHWAGRMGCRDTHLVPTAPAVSDDAALLPAAVPVVPEAAQVHGLGGDAPGDGQQFVTERRTGPSAKKAAEAQFRRPAVA
jgi:hypothetical protein